MPKIELKPNSPEYADQQTQTRVKCCEMPGCTEKADFKAPKHRGLDEYYWFCQEHVREYNNAWDYFSGMSEDDIQQHVNDSIYGFRPTWRYDNFQNLEDDLRAKVHQTQFGNDADPSENTKQNGYQPSQLAPEYEALAIMGLEPPVMLDEIKKRYKELAKKYHPDLNRGCPVSEEKLKKINMSYTMLKLAYAQFETLPER